MSPDPVQGWVNGNPEPLVHALGTVRVSPRRTLILALCRVQVREKDSDVFDPDDPKTCPDCAAYVREGLTFDQASERVDAQVKAAMNDPSTIVCRRGR